MGQLINAVLKESKDTYQEWCEDIATTITKSFLKIEFSVEPYFEDNFMKVLTSSFLIFIVFLQFSIFNW